MTHRAAIQLPQLLTAFVFTIFTFTAGVLHADTHDHSKDNKPANKIQAGEHSGMEQSNRMGDELKLNDKQRELFKNAMGQKMSSMRNGMELHEQLRELTQSEGYSEQKARELVHKDLQAQEDKIVSSSKAMNEFYKSLSAEQKAKLKEMHSKKRTQMKEHMKEHKRDRMREQDGEEEDAKEAHH